MEVNIGSILKFYTILLLNEGPKCGYALIKELSVKTGKGVSASQVYPFLKQLQKNKLITIKKEGAREKKVFVLTKKGQAFITKILSRFGDLLYIAIEPKLHICANCGCKVFEGGYKESIRGKMLAFCCQHCAASYKKYLE
ncbi:MAG: PadR family transcriptional regulator [archaeon]